MKYAAHRFRIPLAVLGLAFLLPSFLAAKDNKQQEAEALLAKARDLSDIRCEGCPAFQLVSRLRVLANEKQVEGSYRLVWISPESWRDEINLPGYSQVQVRGQGKVWRLRNLDHQPLRVYQLMELLNFAQRLKGHESDKARALKRRGRKGNDGNCLEVRRATYGDVEYCFGPEGTLAYEEDKGPVTSRHEYLDYMTWGDRRLPRVLRVLEGKTSAVECDVQEIGPPPSHAENMFVPPSGAQEWPTCENQEPPALMPGSLMDPTERLLTPGITLVSVYAVITSNGEVQNARVVRSAGPALDQVVMRSITRRHYRPSRCDKQAVPQETLIDVMFMVTKSSHTVTTVNPSSNVGNIVMPP